MRPCCGARSLAVKLLIYSPAGSIAAAATTSIPESRAGGKNWDYRFAWVRDLAHTVRALICFGLREETHAAVSWLLTTIRELGPSCTSSTRSTAQCPRVFHTRMSRVGVISAPSSWETARRGSCSSACTGISSMWCTPKWTMATCSTPRQAVCSPRSPIVPATTRNGRIPAVGARGATALHLVETRMLASPRLRGASRGARPPPAGPQPPCTHQRGDHHRRAAGRVGR